MSKLQQGKEQSHSETVDALIAMIDRLQAPEFLYKACTAQDIYSRIVSEPEGVRHLESVLAGDMPDMLAATIELMILTGSLDQLVEGTLWSPPRQHAH